jgi:cbb3-type cytochrome oxidase subunit 3
MYKTPSAKPATSWKFIFYKPPNIYTSSPNLHEMWEALAVFLIPICFLCCLKNAYSPERPEDVAVSNNGNSKNDNRSTSSPEPQTPEREWLFSDDEENLQALQSKYVSS